MPDQRPWDSPADGVTVRELIVMFNGLARRLDDRVKDLERQINEQRFVSLDRYEAESKGRDLRLDKIEADSQWSRRAQVSTMLTVLATAFVLYLQARGAL